MIKEDVQDRCNIDQDRNLQAAHNASIDTILMKPLHRAAMLQPIGSLTALADYLVWTAYAPVMPGGRRPEGLAADRIVPDPAMSGKVIGIAGVK
ncbi:hypothetical protein [Sphingobium yanoikuyae]|uniref:hypothetical protein n=1 Tax=Sphingobium yanoikuyae TaxID=13690 RepID=UPI0035C7B630